VLKDFLWPNSILHRLEDDPELARLAGKLFEGAGGSDASKIGARELGEELMLTPPELSRALGWASPWKSGAAKLAARLIDARYGRAFRRGEKEI
jgi:hypothetical protein